MQPHTPDRRLIDAGPVSVDLCTCGSVHLHISALTLRMEVHSFLQVVDALAIARQRLLQQWETGERVMPGRRTEVA